MICQILPIRHLFSFDVVEQKYIKMCWFFKNLPRGRFFKNEHFDLSINNYIITQKTHRQIFENRLGDGFYVTESF